MGRGLLPVPLCALLRHAGVGSREQVQLLLPLPLPSPFLLGGGALPRPWGGGGPRLWLPSWGGCGGGGGWGAAPPPALGPVWEGGGEWGGPFGPLAMPPDGRRGGGRHGSPGPGGQPSAGGSRPSPAPLYREPVRRAGPHWGPSSPGRCRAALAGRGWP